MLPPARIEIAPDVSEALSRGRGVVALESTLIAHGLPWPDNAETAWAADAAVRAAGAVPATIAVVGGRVRIGLDDAALERLARADGVAKLSRRDLAWCLAGRGAADRLGATTVAATAACAALAGIRVFATGGIGGVHRDAERTFDVSADLAEIARAPLAVVCSGAKAVLDLPRTREVLETLGVPVLGFGTDTLPAFFVRDSGLPVDWRVDDEEEAARILAAHWDLGLGGALLVNPVPAAHALDPGRAEAAMAAALAEARAAGIAGKAATPFLLSRVAELTGGGSRAANRALIKSNAALAGRLAAALAAGAA